MTNFEKLAVLCGLSALGLACSRDSQRNAASAHAEDQPYVGNETAADMTPASLTRSAAEQIAQARCEREQQCGNVGSDKTFSSSQDCLVRIRSDWKDDLNARQCPGGINQNQLEECVSQIRSEDCGNPFDTLARITACTKAQICVEEP